MCYQEARLEVDRAHAYIGEVQLHVARLCLDCNELHDSLSCPLCGSDTWAYLTRWVPASERRQHPRPSTSPEAKTYRELMDRSSSPSLTARFLKGGALGLSAVALASWLWRRGERP